MTRGIELSKRRVIESRLNMPPTSRVIQTWGCHEAWAVRGWENLFQDWGWRATAIENSGGVMGQSPGSDVEREDGEELAARRFRSPLRVWARSFRMSRDNWRQKHHAVQAKPSQVGAGAATVGRARSVARSLAERLRSRRRASSCRRVSGAATTRGTGAGAGAQRPVGSRSQTKRGPGTAVLRT